MRNSITNFEGLASEAERYLNLGPFSVTHKPKLVFSDDPHDYVSGRLYWWKEGENYVRRDGKANPVWKSPEYDRKRLKDLIESVFTLTLAYEALGRQEYAEAAVLYLETWFINPDTKMNPHLEYAQVVPGQVSKGWGIIDTVDFSYLLDAVDVLEQHNLLGEATMIKMRSWFSQFSKWLLTSRPGQLEKGRRNNHGTSYDLQLSRYLMYTGRNMRARWILWRSRVKRIDRQIGPDGVQNRETHRSKSLFYHWYNLSLLLRLSELAARMNINLIGHRNKIECAIRFLAPYLTNAEDWPYEQIEPIKAADTAEAVLIGAELYNIPECKHFAEAHMTDAFFQYRYVRGMRSFHRLLMD